MTSLVSGESRQELLAWLNDLLQLNYTKIEQLGTGAALVQIFDSIYGDATLQRVKFQTQQEYEYVNNFKVLQALFTKHKIAKVIPVDRLVKCKMQDNLEFLQWVKKYWDTYYPGGNYDALARRRGGSAGKTSSQAVNRSKPTSSARSVNPAAVQVKSVKSATAPVNQAQITQLQVVIDGLEKERDFYFSKLRDVETIVQAKQDSVDPKSDVGKFCSEVAAVLYSTEEGFELPAENVEPENIEDETY